VTEHRNQVLGVAPVDVVADDRAARF
jgi:hypothetical protein